MADGFVQALWRFPVVGMAGEQLRSSQVDTRGVAGDRQHYTAGPEGQLTVEDLPALGLWTATYPFNPDGAIVPDKPPPFPVLAGPGGNTRRWGPPRRASGLARDRARSGERVPNPAPTRNLMTATARPELPPRIAGVNIQIALALPRGYNGMELAFRDGVRLRLMAS